MSANAYTPDEPRYIDAVAQECGERLDVFCTRISGETRSFVQRIIDEGGICVDGKIQKSNYKLKAGDKVEITIEPPVPTDIVAEDIPLQIVYEDDSIAVINKPKGMVVHPAPGNTTGTLVNALMFCLSDLSGIGGELRPGIVHRIDKLTSGLIVVAKNDAAHRSLSEQIKAHTARRSYIALVEGNIKQDDGTVDAPIGRHPVDRKRMAVTSNGRDAVTHWRVLYRFGDMTLIAAQLETGRTHQIRVHMAYIKHPVVGDTVYGRAKPQLGLDGQALHAARLELSHPQTGERIIFHAPLPDWFCDALRKAGYDGDVADIDKLFGE
ncbi:MAG: RluA family pseudouridine synthase [Clostridia bacterium]